MTSNTIGISHAVRWVIASVLMVSGSATGITFFSLHLKESRKENPAFVVKELIQAPLTSDSLSTGYLAYLMNLYKNPRPNVYRLIPSHLEALLYTSPVIEYAHVEIRPPQAVYVEYALRRPSFRSGDFYNAGYDAKGVFIPLEPFFSPKNLPVLRLGKKESSYGEVETDSRLELAYELITLIETEGVVEGAHIQEIDLSKWDSQSLGRAEMILTIKAEGNIHFVRLSRYGWKEGLLHYSSIAKELCLQQAEAGVAIEKMIDLRLSNLAFIEDFF